jgi:hypothetical protein
MKSKRYEHDVHLESKEKCTNMEQGRCGGENLSGFCSSRWGCVFGICMWFARARRTQSQHSIIRQIGWFLTLPLVASTLFNANIWLWHAPPLYQQMHANPLLHVWALLLYLATGIL